LRSASRDLRILASASTCSVTSWMMPKIESTSPAAP